MFFNSATVLSTDIVVVIVVAIVIVVTSILIIMGSMFTFIVITVFVILIVVITVTRVITGSITTIGNLLKGLTIGITTATINNRIVVIVVVPVPVVGMVIAIAVSAIVRVVIVIVGTLRAPCSSQASRYDAQTQTKNSLFEGCWGATQAGRSMSSGSGVRC